METIKLYAKKYRDGYAGFSSKIKIDSSALLEFTKGEKVDIKILPNGVFIDCSNAPNDFYTYYDIKKDKLDGDLFNIDMQKSIKKITDKNRGIEILKEMLKNGYFVNLNLKVLKNSKSGARKCEYCKKPFLPKTKTHIYCSDDCKKISLAKSRLPLTDFDSVGDKSWQTKKEKEDVEKILSCDTDCLLAELGDIE